MSTPMKLYAFDYGASSGRGILGEFNGSNLVLNELHRFINQPVTMHKHLHWDIMRLLHEMKEGCAAAVRAGHTDIRSIGINTWGVDFGLLDQHDLLIGNPFHYRDGLTNDAMAQVYSLVPQEELYAQTGLQFLRFNTLFQLKAIQVQYPELLERATSLLFAPDLLGFYLTGEKRTEYTIASTSQMLNAASRNWDYDILTRCGLPTNLLHPITAPATKLGAFTNAVAQEAGFQADVISVCGHDTACAVLATPMQKGERAAYLSCGTWSILGVELDEPRTEKQFLKAQYTNEGGFDNTIRFMKNIMGLWIAQELKREYERAHGAISFDDLEMQMFAATPFASLIDPDDDMFMTPGQMSHKVALYCEQTRQPVPQTLGAQYRCVYESLTLKYRYVLEQLESLLDIKYDALRVVGGGCKATSLMQFTANAIGRTVLAGPIEATSIGNVGAQLIAHGELQNADQVRELVARSFPTTAYEPQDVAVWDNAYNDFCKLIRRS